MVTMTINGRQVKAGAGEMLLAVLRREKIEIPALCHHEAVEPYGGCRLCTVEITKEEWQGKKSLVVSCLYPAEEGLIIQTHTKDLIELRRTILDLYLARCPDTVEIQKLAQEYGLSQTSYAKRTDSTDCILCGLCTRICERMGFGAIAAVQRGYSREIAPPLKEAPADCVGCLACASICPTQHIKYKDSGLTREIWGKKFELLRDKQTKQPAITREFADYLSSHQEIPRDYFDLNGESHRRETAASLGRIACWNREVEK